MKKSFLIITLIIFGSLFCFAQEADNDGASVYYPKTVYIHKVYNHSLGWRIDYIKDDSTLGTFYAPVEWFRESGGIGQITYGTGPSYPYALFFFKDGEVHHFRLFLVESLGHISNEVLDRSVDYTDKFNVSTVDLSFFD